MGREAIRLSELEWEILKPLWEHGPLAARDVYAQVGERNGWAYKTVKTMLARLVAKGAIAYDAVGNSYLYRAAVTREAMTQNATRSFMERLFDGALRPFAVNFAESVSDAELKVLQAELRRIEKARREKKDT
jgi:BlaI family penicillinase repressor